MKKTAFLTCLLFINSLNASDPNPCPTLTAQTIIAMGIMFMATRLHVPQVSYDEPRATLFAFGPFKNEMTYDLCITVTPELKHFAATFCPATETTTPLDPYWPGCPGVYKDQNCGYPRGTCAIPDLGIMERIESTCESKQEKALSSITSRCPVESPEKNDARLKLRKKIIALQKERSGK
jgi:hypothetical protein